ncbi:MAG: MerR family transcriptional regulator, partial [Prevotellaceae bacterium]|nr:MerR family transcriptional regulator [Prevotellaceae bacterium]
MPYKQPKLEKIYFSIGEIAEMFEVNASLIRFWEREFDIIKPQKNKKGNRLFTQKDVDSFRIIYHLVKEEGMTLDGAR